MPNASDIADSIEPGSTEYGDRQVIEERIQQAASQRAEPRTPGAVSGATQDRLSQGSVSDLPITSGLSVGPGAGPSATSALGEGTDIEQFRLIATTARNPLLRKLARDALTAITQRGS